MPSYSHPCPQHKPRLRHPRRHQNKTPKHHRRPRKHLRIQVIPTPPLDQRAANRAPRQRRQPHDTEPHPNPHARLLDVRVQARQCGLQQGLGAGAEEAVEDDEGGHAGRGRDGVPAEEADAGEEDDGDEDVDGAEEAVGEQRGDEAPRDADAVDEEDEVEGGAVREVQDVAGVGADLLLFSLVSRFIRVVVW